jgi:hypothetical protein
MPKLPTRPPTLLVFTIAPPPVASIARISYCIDKNTPLRFTARMWS